jgi:hypothetical protein
VLGGFRDDCWCFAPHTQPFSIGPLGSKSGWHWGFASLSGPTKKRLRWCDRLDLTAEVGQASKQALDGLAGVMAAEVVIFDRCVDVTDRVGRITGPFPWPKNFLSPGSQEINPKAHFCRCHMHPVSRVITKSNAALRWKRFPRVASAKWAACR